VEFGGLAQDGLIWGAGRAVGAQGDATAFFEERGEWGELARVVEGGARAEHQRCARFGDPLDDVARSLVEVDEEIVGD